MRRWLVPLLLVLVVAATIPVWLPLPGTLLVDADPVAPSDVALVLDGVGPDAMTNAERWRLQGVVRYIVIVESPVRSHDLVAYWTDFVRWGVARPSPTPAAYLRVVRADGSSPAAQVHAALGVLRELGAQSVVIPDAGMGSRLTKREARAVLEPAGISVRVSQSGPLPQDAPHWYADPVDRRAVLMLWLQLLVPSDDENATGT